MKRDETVGTKPCKRRILVKCSDEKVTIGEHILASLDYLQRTTKLLHCKAVLQETLHVCFSIMPFIANNNQPTSCFMSQNISMVTEALEFLRAEAERHQLEGLIEILAGAAAFCTQIEQLTLSNEFHDYIAPPKPFMALQLVNQKKTG